MKALLVVACLVWPAASIAQVRTGGVNVGDAVISYESTGQGQAVVLIHGWAQDMSIWDAQVAALSPRYRVIRYDVRGFGESGGFADLSADADDLRVLLDSLHIPQAYVLGLSRGAVIALGFAVNFPSRLSALVLYGVGPPTGFQPMPDEPGPVVLLGEIARKHGLDSAGKVLLSLPLAWMPPERTDLQEALRAAWARYKGRDLLDPRPPAGRIPRTRLEQVNGIRVPTLIIHGDHEMPLFQLVADTLLRRIPDARKVVITNGGHGAHFAQPQQFNDAMLAFFRSVDSRTGKP